MIDDNEEEDEEEDEDEDEEEEEEGEGEGKEGGGPGSETPAQEPLIPSPSLEEPHKHRPTTLHLTTLGAQVSSQAQSSPCFPAWGALVPTATCPLLLPRTGRSAPLSSRPSPTSGLAEQQWRVCSWASGLQAGNSAGPSSTGACPR